MSHSQPFQFSSRVPAAASLGLLTLQTPGRHRLASLSLPGETRAPHRQLPGLEPPPTPPPPEKMQSFAVNAELAVRSLCANCLVTWRPEPQPVWNAAGRGGGGDRERLPPSLAAAAG